MNKLPIFCYHCKAFGKGPCPTPYLVHYLIEVNYAA